MYVIFYDNSNICMPYSIITHAMYAILYYNYNYIISMYAILYYISYCSSGELRTAAQFSFAPSIMYAYSRLYYTIWYVVTLV